MIYLDNAATTPLDEDVRAAMTPFAGYEFGNPSSIHRLGRSARAAVEQARRQIASLVGADESELIFTSGGTEGNHAALTGVWLASPERRHLVTTRVEHHSVLETCSFLQSLGVEVTYVDPSPAGQIRPEDVIAALRPDTACVSVMAVNNETGAVYPVEEIARAVKEKDPQVMVHADMVQALGVLDIRLDASAIDLAVFSAHKVHGPKGCGVLYVRNGARWRPVLHGGAQERRRRAGTENVMGIAGFGAAAAKLTAVGVAAHAERLRRLRDAFWEQICHLPGVRVNSPKDASPAILNVAFAGVHNDTLLMRLDLAGVAASAGAACTAGSLEPSHVLLAMGQPEDEVREAVRFSFSTMNTLAEVERAGALVAGIVTELRQRHSWRPDRTEYGE